MHKNKLQSQAEAVIMFFQHLAERRWKDAESLMNSVQTFKQNVGEDWLKGYSDALQGMLIGLKDRHSSPESFILNVGNHNLKGLKELTRTFNAQSRERLNTDYDRGFFKAWYDYAKYLRDKGSRS